MEKRVTVLMPNGRRQNVKVTPNTTLLQILEEACQKHGFNSDEFGLKHYNKEVDLTLMFRFTGLPNNCVLEMSQTERKRARGSVRVSICVQLEDGSRATGAFLPSDNLWHVVEHLNARAAADYVSPVCVYMRQEIVGRQTMLSTTLKSLGITGGSAMIRFLNKSLEELKIQANVYIPPTVKEEQKEENPKSRGTTPSTSTAGGFAITKDLMRSLAKNSEESSTATSDVNAMDDDGNGADDDEQPQSSKPLRVTIEHKYDWGPGSGRSMRSTEEIIEDYQHEITKPEPQVNIIGERSAIIYSLDDAQKQIDDLPDSFFDLTVHDLKLVLRDLHRTVEGNADAPLLTERLRELEENKVMLNKIALYKNCVIRVQFPDRHVLQGTFKPIETVPNVIEFVRKFLRNPATKFYLFTIPPKTVLPLDKTLLELDFVPTAVVHFGVEEEAAKTSTLSASEQNFIKEEYLQQLTTAEGAFHVAHKLRSASRKSTSDEANNNGNNATAQYEHRSPGPSTGAIPKRPRSDKVQQQLT